MELSEKPFAIDIDIENGIMLKPQRHLVHRASDMRGLYKDEQALEELIQIQDNPVHYEVFETPVPEEDGHLMYCISKLQPGIVGNEFFMTKGHYHTITETAEIYLCLSGKGYMMMKTAQGESASEGMARGKMVYVPPYWAHRSINTGNDPLISFCVYPAHAGHNYGDIGKGEFAQRIFKINGEIIIE